MNTAARMESNSQRNRIMVSQATADLITGVGKGHWLTPRDDLVQAKGKGAMQCYWCLPKTGTHSAFSGHSDMAPSDVDDEPDIDTQPNQIEPAEQDEACEHGETRKI